MEGTGSLTGCLFAALSGYDPLSGGFSIPKFFLDSGLRRNDGRESIPINYATESIPINYATESVP